MANRSESISPLEKLKRWMSGWFWMGSLSNLGNVTPLASESKNASTSSAVLFSSVCSTSLNNEKKAESVEGSSVEGSSVEDDIEQSKVHWSELTKHENDGKEVAEVSNMEVFKSLQRHPTWGHFFRTFGDGGMHDNGKLVVGEKFVEGAQAELYHVHVTWKIPELNSRDHKRGIMWVLKVFKKGTFLQDLQKQWPQGMFRQYEEIVKRGNLGKSHPIKYISDINCGTLLPNGRLGFLLVRKTEDLWTFIDRKMKARTSLDCGPFSIEVSVVIMYLVGNGVDWLNNLNIVHWDLKSANVLCAHVNKNTDKEGYDFYVADFECSIGVVGTGFFRAPEILQALKDKTVYKRPNLFTKASDVYSYGMVCYEILTGKTPFEGHPINDFGIVLDGQQLDLPHYVDKWVRDLLRRCWQSDPSARPTIGEILKLFEASSRACKGHRMLREEKEMMPLEMQKNLGSKYEFES